jgi:hypothetical protein
MFTVLKAKVFRNGTSLEMSKITENLVRREGFNDLHKTSNTRNTWRKNMKRFRYTISTVALTITLSSGVFAGTIVGARASRTGTIVGARSGNIVGARTGNITGARTRNISGSSVSPNFDQTRRDIGILVSENIIDILRLLLDSTF